MKHIKLSVALLFLYATVGCKKCYNCETELPIDINGVVVSTVHYEEEVCGRKWVVEPEVEAMEESGYTCTEVDN